MKTKIVQLFIVVLKAILKCIYSILKLLPVKENKILFCSRQSECRTKYFGSSKGEVHGCTGTGVWSSISDKAEISRTGIRALGAGDPPGRRYTVPVEKNPENTGRSGTEYEDWRKRCLQRRSFSWNVLQRGDGSSEMQAESERIDFICGAPGKRGTEGILSAEGAGGSVGKSAGVRKQYENTGSTGRDF